jgi:hypothetical protein
VGWLLFQTGVRHFPEKEICSQECDQEREGSQATTTKQIAATQITGDQAGKHNGNQRDQHLGKKHYKPLESSNSPFEHSRLAGSLMAILLDIQAMLVNQTLSQINTAFQIQDLASLTTTDLSLKESQAPTWISSGHVMAPRDKQC